MSAREAILGRVRASLGRGRLDVDKSAELDARLNAPIANLVPARGQVSGAAAVKDFIQMTLGAAATLEEVATDLEIPAAIARYLASENLPARLVQTQEIADRLDWDAVPQVETRSGPAVSEDEVGLAMALAGVAETGTLILRSGAQAPTTVNFLPDTHIVVLRRDDVVGGYEEAWARLRETCLDADGRLPRTVNMITGPSRTGDIEQTLQLGAHGPRRQHVVLVG